MDGILVVEDTDEFNRLYSQVEAWATTSDEADDLELLGNLWTVLHIPAQQEQLTNRYLIGGDVSHYCGGLGEMSQIFRDPTTPWARTQLLLNKLISAINKPDEIGPILADLARFLKHRRAYHFFFEPHSANCGFAICLVIQA